MDVAIFDADAHLDIELQRKLMGGNLARLMKVDVGAAA